MSNVIITVPANPATVVVTQPSNPATVIVDIGTTGPAGPAGAGATSFEYVQSTALATWTINLTSDFATRRPNVAVYAPSGERIFADITVTTTTVSITFSSPQTGFAVIS